MTADARWLLYSLISLMAWGAWATFAAQAGKHGTALGVAAGAALLEAMTFVPWYPQIKQSGSWWLLAAGVVSAVAYGAMFMAFRSGGPEPSVIAITSMYPVVATVLTVIVTGQGVSIRQAIGICMAVGATILLAGV